MTYELFEIIDLEFMKSLLSSLICEVHPLDFALG